MSELKNGAQAKMGFTQATQDMHAVCVMWEGGGSLGTISKIQPPFSFLSATGLEETEREETLLLPHGLVFSLTFLFAITG